MPHSRILTTVALLASGLAAAQNLKVIPVPWSPTDLTTPHLAYDGHATLFKAIARGGNGTYQVEWDFDGDGTFDTSAVTTNRYGLSAVSTFPTQAADKTFNAVVRVTSNGETKSATYPVQVIAGVPASPATATDAQLAVMRTVAVDDGLWFLHTSLVRTGNEADPLYGAQVTATVPPADGLEGVREGAVLEALGRTGHFPAFPSAYLGALPDPSTNARRWATDPYAEDAARLVNSLLTRAFPITVTAADETNTIGLDTVETKTPIPGTDDGFGLWIGMSATSGVVQIGPCAAALRALAVSHLTGYVAQVGDFNRVLGRRYEFIIQQFVDALTWAQNDAGYVGAWPRLTNLAGSTGVDSLGEFDGGTIDAAQAMWTAEQWMGVDGVIVPSLVKIRLAQYLYDNANTCPTGGSGGSLTTASNGICDFALTSAHVFGLGWVGANHFGTGDIRAAFPGYSWISPLRLQFRSRYDATLVFITNVFTSVSNSSIGWDMGFVEGGDFTRTDGKGDHWAMVHWARAARAVEPEIVTFGPHDYLRLFSRYLVGNQTTGGGWTWTASSPVGNLSDAWAGAVTRAAWAVLTLTPGTAMSVPPNLTLAQPLMNFVDSPSAACPGGRTVQWGLDDGVPGGTRGDGVLSAAEVQSSTLVCDGQSATVTDAGNHCAHGGIGVSVAGGPATYICNGADGANGANGTNGVNGTNGADGLSATIVDAGTNCPNGGIGVSVSSGPVNYICNGTNGTNGTNGANGTNGVDGQSATVVDAGAHCPTGGIGISVGSGPVTYICNGAPGTNGTNGTSGIDGQSATLSDAGTHCPQGGVAVSVGSGPVSYICNGADGAAGQSVIIVGAGSNCPAGGIGVSAGSGPTGWVCNGISSVVLVAEEPAGGHCAQGGQRIDTGLDANGNQTLDASEVTSSSYVCNGAPAPRSGCSSTAGNLQMWSVLLAMAGLSMRRRPGGPTLRGSPRRRK